MSTTEFNYKFIKENASAGSWRRGYEYHTKDMVFDNYPEKNFYMAKVKGNFQDHYNTDLIFKKNKLFYLKISFQMLSKTIKYIITNIKTRTQEINFVKMR